MTPSGSTISPGISIGERKCSLLWVCRISTKGSLPVMGLKWVRFSNKAGSKITRERLTSWAESSDKSFCMTPWVPTGKAMRPMGASRNITASPPDVNSVSAGMSALTFAKRYKSLRAMPVRVKSSTAACSRKYRETKAKSGTIPYRVMIRPFFIAFSLR